MTNDTTAQRANKIAWLLRSWRGERSLRDVSQETGIGIATLSRYEGGRWASDVENEAVLKLLDLTWESLDEMIICWFPEPCRHERADWLASDTITDEVATSWIERDDDGYPNEVFGDREFTWQKHYDVCLDCGKIREFDGYAMVEAYDDQVPGRIKKLAKTRFEESRAR
jgi:transcriptional regulator with XRE-family HTH domain